MNKETNFYKLERQINAKLATMNPENRPETSVRTKIKQINYQATGAFEATDTNGNVESVPAEVVMGWLS